jgi:alcohol dehydrogenase
VKAWGIRRYKDPVELLELPRPEPGPNDLLVKVRAASVNPVDFKIRDGGVKVLIPYRFPLVLGNDLAGDVEAVGVSVTRFKPGDAIYARLDKGRIGAFAEWALVSESACAPKPILDRRFPFDATREAVAYVESGKAVGKVIVDVAP